MNPVRVLIVDDSASVRRVLSAMLADDPQIKVIGTAADPFAAARRLEAELPDVMILDIEMPRMDGLTFLRKVMAQHPIPVVICSSLAEGESRAALDALEAGAVDILAKPRVDTPDIAREAAEHVRRIIKAAAQIKPRARRTMAEQQKLTADAMIPAPSASRVRVTTDRIVCIGISTGGTETLREVLQVLPAHSPAILVVQHMPERFTDAFARRLDRLCAMDVKEAADGDEVRAGRVLIAPGSRHMLVQRMGARYRAAIKDGPPVSRHRPSADVLFRSAALYAGPNAMGVIMTGMGDDGANGLLEMRRAGARTLAQDEASCVVFGMPKEAIARGAAERIAAPPEIAREIVGWLSAERRDPKVA